MQSLFDTCTLSIHVLAGNFKGKQTKDGFDKLRYLSNLQNLISQHGRGKSRFLLTLLDSLTLIHHVPLVYLIFLSVISQQELGRYGFFIFLKCVNVT